MMSSEEFYRRFRAGELGGMDFAEWSMFDVISGGIVCFHAQQAAEARYPEFEEPRLEDAKKAVEIAEEVKDFVLERLPRETTWPQE